MVSNDGSPCERPLLSRRDSLFASFVLVSSASPSAAASASSLWPHQAWIWGQREDIGRSKLMDAEFANILIDSMASVAGTTRTGEYLLRCASLREEKLPHYQDAQKCGHCGARKGPGAFRDPDFFDFETYVRGKALLQMAPGDENPETKRDQYLRNANIAMGSYILRHILEERYTEDAERMGISPFFSVSALSGREDSLLSASPELESVRDGVKSLLEYFQRRGFVRKAGISQCGASVDDEFETQLAWIRGNGSANLTYWLVAPVDENSSLALQSEEGTYLGYVSATIVAFLRRCGVRASNVSRVRSLKVDGLVIEQSRLTRTKPLNLNDGAKWELKGKNKWSPNPIPSST
jgi:hypothetical protein